MIWFTLINYDHTQGCRSKIESGKAKFYGQFLASLWTELEISTISESNLVLKAAHAWGSGCMSPQEILNYVSSEMTFWAILD